MSAVIPIVIRLLGLFGVSLSPFAAGAIVAAVIAGAIGGAGLHVYNAGFASAQTKCDAAALKSQIDAMRRDRDAAREALGDERTKTAAIEKQANDDKEGTAAYVDQLKKSFSDACAITDDDLRGMRAPSGTGGGAKGTAPRAGFLDAARRRAKDLQGR